MTLKIPSPFSSRLRAVSMVVLIWPIIDPKHDITFLIGFGSSALAFCNVWGYFTGDPIGHSATGLLENTPENESMRFQVMLLSLFATVGFIFVGLFVEGQHHIHIWRDH